jgi:hypothetical protein
MTSRPSLLALAALLLVPACEGTTTSPRDAAPSDAAQARAAAWAAAERGAAPSATPPVDPWADFARAAPAQGGAPAIADAGPQPDAESSAVVVNGERVDPRELARLERELGVRTIPGRYWYDARCGAWGYEGQGQAGLLPAGLRVGGKLRADASAGDTGVFVNGRELAASDVAVLSLLGPVYPGRYWVDAYGNFGLEGGPALGNLVALARAANTSGGGNGGGGGDNYYHSDATGISMNSDASGGYIMGKDFSVSW